MNSATLSAAILALGTLVARPAGVVKGEVLYQLKTEIPIGGDGGWDYLSVDEAARRLYIAHATKIDVVDIDKDAVVGEIPDVHGAHGFAVAPLLNRGFASAGQASTVVIADLVTLKVLSTVDTGANPDTILFDPDHGEVYAFNGRGNSATVFDAASGTVRKTIPLPGKPEFAVLDRPAHRIYNNIEDRNVVVVIDTGTHEVVTTWPIAPGEDASGLAFDAEHHRLFIGCSNRLMLMMDSRSGEILGKVPIGAGVDANAFDPQTGLAFASSSDGTLTAAHVDTAGEFTVVQTIATPFRSRTMTLDPRTHRLFVAAAQFAAPEPGPDGKPVRPQVVPGSFRILVYELTRR